MGTVYFGSTLKEGKTLVFVRPDVCVSSWAGMPSPPQKSPSSGGRGLSLVSNDLSAWTRVLDRCPLHLGHGCWTACPLAGSEDGGNQRPECGSDVSLTLVCSCLLGFLPHSSVRAVKIYKIVSSGPTAPVVGGVGCVGVGVCGAGGLLSLNISARVVSST